MRTVNRRPPLSDASRRDDKILTERVSQAALTVLSNDLKRVVRELEASRKETAVLRNSVSLAVGVELVSAIRRPLRLLFLPVVMVRAVRKVLASRQVTPTVTHKRLTKTAAVMVVNATPVIVEQDAVADQAYELSVDVVGERIPCRKGVALEILMDASELTGFLQRNPHFQKSLSAASALIYIDITGVAVQRVSTVLWTTQASSGVCLSLSRFRGTDPITMIVHTVRAVRPEEALARLNSVPVEHARLPTNKSLKVLSILDTFTESCLEPEIELMPVSKSDWRLEFDRGKPDLLFVESAWRGNGGEWKYALTNPDKYGSELKQLVAHCSSKKVPTLFWNKEDPVNFETFIDAAEWFDFVFTTDAGSLNRYREVLGRDNVFALPFAAQPTIHNPVRRGEMIPRIAFTGSWRGKKYPVRAQWIETLLDPLAEADLLDIFDRYAGTTDNPDLIFPHALQRAVQGALPYKDLVNNVYKRYSAFVSVNSVDDSDTMLARRVFEILACGAPVISSPSPAIENTFGDIVMTPSTQAEALDISHRLLDDLVFRERLASRGVRLVHSEHTYTHRLDDVCDRIGLPYIARRHKLVSAICVSNRPEFLAHVHSQLSRQKYAFVELIFVQNSAKFSEAEIVSRFSEFEQFKLLSVPEECVLADGLNAALKLASGEYVAKIDDDDFYGPNYLSDALLAFEYAPSVGLVGKRSFFAYLEATDQTVLRFPGQSYRFCRQVHGGTMVWDRRKLEELQFEPVPKGADTRFLEGVRRLNVNVFSADPFNFVHVRRADKAQHTWTIDDTEFLSKTIKVGTGLREDIFLT